MKTFTRRNFLKTSGLGVAALGLDSISWGQPVGANGDLRVAQIGFHGQGGSHLKSLTKMKGVRLVALCDVDRHVLDGKAKELGGNIQTYTDLRKLLENKDVDAVSIAIPNHWHALATIWACQAGKDVYVEKPACHNLTEGRRMIEAARKYNRIVQHGTQCRSSPGLREAAQYVREGHIGKVDVTIAKSPALSDLSLRIEKRRPRSLWGGLSRRPAGPTYRSADIWRRRRSRNFSSI